MDENHDISKAHRKRVIRRRWLVVLATMLIALVIGWIIVYKPSMEYVGRVKFAVDLKSESSVFSKIAPSQERSADWPKTELSIVTSNENMRRVVRDLNLTEKWSLRGDENAAILKLSLLVKPYYESETKLIVVEVHSNSREEAILLANAVGDAYVKRRKELKIAHAQSAIDQLEKELKDQRQSVDAKRTEMLRLMEQFNIDSPGDNAIDIEGTSESHPTAPNR